MNNRSYSTHPILPARPSLPPLRSLDICRYLPTPSSEPPSLADFNHVSVPTSASPHQRSLNAVEEQEEEEEEGAGEEVVVLESKLSSRIGIKLATQVCMPCKKQHTCCSNSRPCPRCCRKGIEHLCVNAPSRRGKKTAGVKSAEGKLVRPPLHRIPVKRPAQAVTNSSNFSTSSASRQLPSLAKPSRSAPGAPRYSRECTTPLVDSSSSTSPSSLDSSPSTDDTLPVTPPRHNSSLTLPALRARPATLSFSRYFETSDSSDGASIEGFPISSCRK